MNVIAPRHLAAPILLADANAADAARTEGVLRDIGYQHIRTTGDLREISGLYHKWPFALLVISIAPGETAGFKAITQLASEINTHGHSGAVPAVLAILEGSDQKGRDKILGIGARDFITRPFSWPEMISRVRNLLDIRHMELGTEKIDSGQNASV